MSKAISGSKIRDVLRAYIEMAPFEPNPKVTYKESDSSYIFEISMKNFGNDAAINLVDYFKVVNYRRGKVAKIIAPTNHLTNRSQSIPANSSGALVFRKGFYFLDKKGRQESPSEYEHFIYVKIDYTNTKGERMRPFRRILELINGEAKEIDNLKYDRVEADLIRLSEF